MEQNRFLSKAAWLTVIANVCAALIAFGVIAPDMGDAIKVVLVSVLELLALAGIFNNPTDKTNY